MNGSSYSGGAVSPTALAAALADLPELLAGLGTLVDDTVPGFVQVHSAGGNGVGAWILPVSNVAGPVSLFTAPVTPPEVPGVELFDSFVIVASGFVTNTTGGARDLTLRHRITDGAGGVQLCTLPLVSIPNGTNARPWTLVATLDAEAFFGTTSLIGHTMQAHSTVMPTSTLWSTAAPTLVLPNTLTFDLQATFGGAPSASFSAACYSIAVRPARQL